jgi:thiol-disulfide isomerase/thioredoxin
MLKKILIILFISTAVHAQHSIKGKLNHEGQFSWMILYQLVGAKQNYITNTTITNGEFELIIPKNHPAGIYRLVYDIKRRLFVDVLYNQEDISLTFDALRPYETKLFIKSDENKIYENYQNAILGPQQRLDSLQVSYLHELNTIDDRKIIDQYHKVYAEINLIQSEYESRSKTKLAQHFIKASARYNAENPIKNNLTYLRITKDHFFDPINFSDEVLLNSNFINNKINDYIFYLNISDDKNVLDQMQKEAILTVIDKIDGNKNLTKDIEEGLLNSFAEKENIIMVNFVLNNYLKLPKALQDVNFVKSIKAQLKTAIGMRVPDIKWYENGLIKDLYKLNISSYYILAFWSSTCPHCLKEMPLLYDFIRTLKGIQVIAVGLEDDASKINWENEHKKFQGWIHIYGDHKWENKYARVYDINATPTFFILDDQKRVLAKPDDIEELKSFFESVK